MPILTPEDRQKIDAIRLGDLPLEGSYAAPEFMIADALTGGTSALARGLGQTMLPATAEALGASPRLQMLAALAGPGVLKKGSEGLETLAKGIRSTGRYPLILKSQDSLMGLGWQKKVFGIGEDATGKNMVGHVELTERPDGSVVLDMIRLNRDQRKKNIPMSVFSQLKSMYPNVRVLDAFRMGGKGAGLRSYRLGEGAKGLKPPLEIAGPGTAPGGSSL